MLSNFLGDTANDVWIKIAKTLHKGKDVFDQPSRNGPTKEILHAAICIKNPSARWVVSRVPVINPAYAFAELIWTITGRQDSAFLVYFNRNLPQFSGNGITFHGAYGNRLRKHFGLDQLVRAYQALQRNPAGRQIVLQIWDAKIDFPNTDGSPKAEDIPCNIVSLLKVRNSRLEWMQIMRSNDIFIGVPFDIALFTSMQEIMAGWLGIELGSYCHISDSLHAYERDLSNIKASCDSAAIIEGAASSSLALSFKESKMVFRSLSRSVEKIIDDKITTKSLLDGLRRSKLPPSYKDMLGVLTAEGLRRRNQIKASHEAIDMCEDPFYRQLWLSWLNRHTQHHAK